MKVMVLGGTHDRIPIRREVQEVALARLAGRLGEELARKGHDLIACSPYPGSADLEALHGWAKVASAEPPPPSRLELHYPDDPDLVGHVTALRSEPGLAALQPCRHPPSYLDGKLELTYSWMLPQLAALDRADALVAIGGNPEGSANLLLQLAATRRVPVLPLGQIGGAAAGFLERNRYVLGDLLGEDILSLEAPDGPPALTPLLRALTEPGPGAPPRRKAASFFISYPRARPQEADFAEMMLRRRGYEVFRDDRNFGAGDPVAAEIDAYIRRADVFVAIWCAEYACSPWCHDELELALNLHAQEGLRLAIFCVDGIGGAVVR